MKKILVAWMLVGQLWFMGQRWEYSHQAGILMCQGMPQRCSGGEPMYRLMYVIGELVPGTCKDAWAICEPSIAERFTIPVSNTLTKAMTKDEAERANKELMK